MCAVLSRRAARRLRDCAPTCMRSCPISCVTITSVPSRRVRCWYSASSAASSLLSARSTSRSGRRSHVRPSDCLSRHRRISAWCPDNSTSGTATAVQDLRPRVMRTIQQARRERILLRGLLVVQCAGQLARHGVDQHQRRQFATRHHKIPDRDFLVGLLLQQPFVNSFIAPGEQHITRIGRPPPAPTHARGSAEGRRAKGGRPPGPALPTPFAPPWPPLSPATAVRPASPFRVRRHKAGRPPSCDYPS